MFTLEQIADAHKKVTSGAAFTAYIQELKGMGVTYYETFVRDGHTSYSGRNNYKITSKAKYNPLGLAATSNETQFKNGLRAHQKGKTDYPTFCKDAAKSGIEKWAVCLEEMTCTYYDTAGNKVLVEDIPHK